jgi:hypothetical protein
MTRSRATSAVVKDGDPKTAKAIPPKPQEPMDKMSARPVRNAAQAVSALYERLADEENIVDEDVISLADEYKETPESEVDHADDELILIQAPKVPKAKSDSVKGKRAAGKAKPVKAAAVNSIESNESSDEERKYSLEHIQV